MDRVLQVGELIAFKSRPKEKHVVVLVNDCRAKTVLLKPGDEDNPAAVFSYEEAVGTGISPTSEVHHLGWAKGNVRVPPSTFYVPKPVTWVTSPTRVTPTNVRRR